jgi:hypothetical protein
MSRPLPIPIDRLLHLLTMTFPEKGFGTFAHDVSRPEMNVPKGTDRDLTGTPLLWRHVAKQTTCDLASREATHKFSKPGSVFLYGKPPCGMGPCGSDDKGLGDTKLSCP